MECHPTRVNRNEARKRTAEPSTWKKNIAKKNRYAAKMLPRLPQCKHHSKKLQRHLVTTKILRMFHEAFYKNASKIQQDALLLKCCKAVAVKRKRPRNGKKASKEFTTKFHIIADRKNIPVCQKAFLNILNIKKGRILSLVTKSFKTGEFPVDKRGGDHKSHRYTEIQKSVHTFMTKLKCHEPHYCRSQTSVRKTMVTMCCKWLLEHPTIKTVELVFPVTGHSYLPADRVFGNTEKRFRKMDTIISPNEYINIISEEATIMKVGDDFPVYDFKSAAENIIKAPGQWKVNFSQCKRFYIKRSKRGDNVLVNGDLFYKTRTGTFENICKKGKKISMLAIDNHILRKGVTVKKLKLRDVDSLLNSYFGDDWRNRRGLTFYSQILDGQADENNQSKEPEEKCASNSTNRHF